MTPLGDEKIGFSSENGLEVIFTEKGLHKLNYKERDEIMENKHVNVRLIRRRKDGTDIEELYLPLLTVGVVGKGDKEKRDIFLPIETFKLFRAWQRNKLTELKYDSQTNKLIISEERKEAIEQFKDYNTCDVYTTDIGKIEKVQKAIHQLGYQSDSIWYQQRRISRIYRFTVIGTLIITAIVMGISTFQIFVNMSSTVRMRRHEIVLMKLLGGTNSYIRNIYLFNALIAIFISVILGLIFAVGLSWLGNFLLQSVQIGAFKFAKFWHPIAIIVIGIGLPIISAAFPARKASKQDLVEGFEQ